MAVMNEIWIVDDQALVREVLTTVLDMEGYRVRAFATSDETLNALRDLPVGAAPRLLILDLQLRENSGLTVLEAIWRNPALAPVRVALLSDADDCGNGEGAHRPQADYYLPKPVDLNELRRAAREACVQGNMGARLPSLRSIRVCATSGLAES